MINNKMAYDILKECLEFVKFKYATVILEGGKRATTRFANNSITDNILFKDYIVTVEVSDGKKVGSASINDFQKEKLQRVVEQAETIAKYNSEIDNWVDYPTPYNYSLQENFKYYCDETANATPMLRKELVNIIVEKAKENSQIAAGVIETSDNMVAIMNTNGLFVYDTFTKANIKLTISNNKGSTGYASSYEFTIKNFNPETLASNAILKAKLNTNHIKLASDNYTVILEPQACANLITYLPWLAFGAKAYLENKSIFSEKLGKKITGDNVTIIDNAYDPLVRGLPFDYYGSKRKKVTLIENGLAIQPVFDRLTAQVAGKENTGHALPPYFKLYGPVPQNLIFSPGTSSVDEMIKSTKKGILITRFWYENVVDPKKVILTGMTRDGTFLIENGEITKAVKNMRFNMPIFEAFNNIEMIGDTLVNFDDYVHVACPALKINKFRFTGISSE